MLNFGLQRAREISNGPIARASLTSLAVRVAGLPLSLLQAVLTARLLGAGSYGTVAVTISVVQIVATFCMFGLPSLATRDIPVRIARGNAGAVLAFLRKASLIVLALSSAAGAALAFMAAATELDAGPYRATLEIGAFLLPLVALLGLIAGTARGFGRILVAQLPDGIVRPATMILLLGIVALLGFSLSPLTYMWLTVGAAVVTIFVGYLWLWRIELSLLPQPPAKADTGMDVTAALSFLGLGLTAMLQGQINTLLLGWLASPHETGLFQPIARLMPILALPVQAASMRFAPRIAELWEDGELGRIRSLSTTFTWTTSVVTLGVALPVAAAGPWLMWMFGSEFQQSAPLLWYVCIAQVFSAACGPVGILLTMSGAGGRAFIGQGVALTANVAVGVFLIPHYGALGAAIAMAFGLVVWNLVLLAMTISRCRFDPTLVGVLVDVRYSR